jgi:hypothetical protein
VPGLASRQVVVGLPQRPVLVPQVRAGLPVLGHLEVEPEVPRLLRSRQSC